MRVIPTKYPSGGAKQLTKILTGREVPSGGRSSDIGVLMQNVGTVVAIKRAITDGEPLIQRVVTVTGEAVESPVTSGHDSVRRSVSCCNRPVSVLSMNKWL